MNKNNILTKSNNVKPYDWEKMINNSDDVDDKELIDMIRKYNQCSDSFNRMYVFG